MKLLTVHDLSDLIRKSPATIRSAASRSPNSLPPICRLPASKRLLWRDIDVHQWIDNHVNIKTRGKVKQASEVTPTCRHAALPANPTR